MTEQGVGAVVPDRLGIVARLGEGRYAVDSAGVAEVARPPSLTRIPGLPSWVIGAGNWRGAVLPILDLRVRLGAEPAAVGSLTRLLVLADAGVSAGLLVDAVEGTMSIGDDIAPVPDTLDEAAGRLISGQIPGDKGPVAVLDVASILRLREDLPRARPSA